MSPLNITGLGLVSPLGSSVADFWRRIRSEDGTPIDLPDAIVEAGKVPNRRFYVSEISGESEGGSRYGLAFDLAASAIRQAVNDAEIQLADERVGLVLGTGAGAIHSLEQGGFAPNGADVSCIDGAYTLAAELGQHFRFTGPVLTVSTACSASAAAFSLAREVMEDGGVDAVVVCGVETISRTTLAAFNKLQALDVERCRPFEESRGGTVFGDGAAALVLRSEQTMVGRRVYARLCGIGLSCDAHHPTAPRPDGSKIVLAARSALQEAGITEEDIGLIVPHGTGTVANDQAEYAMLCELFGERLASIPIFPLKGKIGHSGGGAGAFSALTLALMLHHQEVPPAAMGALARDFALCIPRGSSMRVRARNGLVNAYSFGGNQVSLVLEAA